MRSKQRLHVHWTIGMKWTAAISATVFFTFLGFSLILYASFSNSLIAQERTATASTAHLIADRLANIDGNFTIATVVPAMSPNSVYDSPPFSTQQADSSRSFKIYNDAIFRELARADLSVNVYSAQREEIFSSRTAASAFKAAASEKVRLVKNKDHPVLAITVPIYNQRHQTIRGYLFITNRMSNYVSTTTKIRWQLVWLLVFAIIFSTLIGMIVASRFTKPIKIITSTVSQLDAEPESEARIPPLSGHDELTDLAEQFNKMLDQMQAYITAQKEFVGDVSHELRTPIAILQGHLQMLTRWGKDDPEVLNESLAASMHEVTRMNNLVKEMLDLTRAEQIDPDHVEETVAVASVLPQILDNLAMIHPKFTLQIDNDCHLNSGVSMTRNHFEQIIVILVDNAIKYSTDRSEINISSSDNTHEVEIIVQDYGMGISPEDQQRIFDRFYRVDKARSRERGGNGLGLAIAFKLVHLYGGKLEVSSQLNVGSQFKVTLPRIELGKITQS